MPEATSAFIPEPLRSLHYSDPSSRLRTLDIWLPQPREEQKEPGATWIIYVHGGAWRDPDQTSACAEPTIQHLFSEYSEVLPHIAGIASLNYRLSPYAAHETDPSSPSDEERNVVHPTHVRDVVAGIEFLFKEYGVTRWIGVGHSCGATLLLQVAAGIGSHELGSPFLENGPEALLLLEGIYNIPLLLHNHSVPTCTPQVAQIYVDIAAGAFGPASSPSVYQSVSPVAGNYSGKQWPNGRLVILAHSYEDELVERAQRDVMCVTFDRQGWAIVMEDGDEEDHVVEGRRVLNVRDVTGTHDWVWQDGEQVAKLIANILERLN